MVENALAAISILVSIGTSLDELNFLRELTKTLCLKGLDIVDKPAKVRRPGRHIVQYKVQGPESKI